jgi:cobalt/nickel transport system permease protein
MLFQFGGITTLGINTVILAAPGVVCHYLFARRVNNKSNTAAFSAFLCGFISILLSGLFASAALWFTDGQFIETALAVLAAHLPVMIVEGIITASCISFLKKVDSGLLPEFSG